MNIDLTKPKEIMTNWKVLLLIVFIVGSILAINPNFHAKGVAVVSVADNTSASFSGLQANEIIKTLNGKEIADENSWASAVSDIEIGSIVKLSTNKKDYSFVAENITDLGIKAKQVPTSNIRKGLDLVGGARVLLKPEGELTSQQMQDVIDITSKRLNVYGLTDIITRQVSDLEGNKYILVEMAGSSQEDAVKLVSSQGVFEAKIGNDTVFQGGKDIKQVCRSAECSGVRNCEQSQDGGWACQFQFSVSISPEAAKTHADLTRNLSVELVGNKQYLSKKLDLYLDKELVDSLYISADLQGSETTTFMIEGPGSGSTEETALKSALDNMKKLQTVLITGSLPVKLMISKVDIVSPTLGENFFSSALVAVTIAIFAVGVAIFVRYRRLIIALPIILTSASEVLIILGAAALIHWNLDLAAIAGLLAVVGTGIDNQIVITEEIIGKKAEAIFDWKERLKRAFFIIMGSYLTIVVAMIPLWAMGASLLKGFAIVTIIGVTIGVFITRPAFAVIIEKLLK